MKNNWKNGFEFMEKLKRYLLVNINKKDKKCIIYINNSIFFALLSYKYE